MAKVISAGERLAPVEANGFALFWQRFRRQRGGLVALIVLGALVASIILVPAISPFGHLQVNPLSSFATAGATDPMTGYTHWLGADYIGRDLFTRLFYGGRVSLGLALLATLITMSVGTVIGVAAGYFGGVVDTVLMRVTDFLLALPLLPMYIFGSRLLMTTGNSVEYLESTMGGMLNVFLVFTFFGWMGLSRLVRASVLTLRKEAFIEASTALGAGHRRIIFRHLLPNTLAPVFVAATFQVGDFIIWESILAYFVQGIFDPPTPSWGNMLVGGIQYVSRITNLNPFTDIRAYLFLMPNVMIFVTVLCLNYIGDALSDVLNPRRTRQR